MAQSKTSFENMRRLPNGFEYHAASRLPKDGIFIFSGGTGRGWGAGASGKSANLQTYFFRRERLSYATAGGGAQRAPGGSSPGQPLASERLPRLSPPVAYARPAERSALKQGEQYHVALSGCRRNQPTP